MCRISQLGDAAFYFFNKELELWIKQKGHLFKTALNSEKD